MTEGFTERNKRIARSVAEREVKRTQEMPERLGLTPWDAPKLTDQEKVELFATLRGDVAALRDLHEEYRRRYGVGPGRVSVRFRKEMQAMERLYQRFLATGRVEAVPPVPDPMMETLEGAAGLMVQLETTPHHLPDAVFPNPPMPPPDEVMPG